MEHAGRRLWIALCRLGSVPTHGFSNRDLGRRIPELLLCAGGRRLCPARGRSTATYPVACDVSLDRRARASPALGISADCLDRHLWHFRLRGSFARDRVVQASGSADQVELHDVRERARNLSGRSWPWCAHRRSHVVEAPHSGPGVLCAAVGDPALRRSVALVVDHAGRPGTTAPAPLEVCRRVRATGSFRSARAARRRAARIRRGSVARLRIRAVSDAVPDWYPSF